MRQKADERWRETIQSLVLAGHDAGEFRPVNCPDFADSLSALLDGFAIQIALADAAADAVRAFDLSMRFAAEQLGFEWIRSDRRGGKTGQLSSGRPDVGGAGAGAVTWRPARGRG